MYYSASVIYTATLQALHGHIFFLTDTQYLHSKTPITQMAKSDKGFSLKVNGPVTVLHVMLYTCKSHWDSCPNWAMGMIFWQINSYGVIVLQGCLIGLKPLWTAEEDINTWSKRERGFPSSFLMPSITVDLADGEETIMHKTKLRYGTCLPNLTGKIKWVSTKPIWTKDKI